MANILYITPTDPVFPETAFLILTSIFTRLGHPSTRTTSEDITHIQSVITQLERLLQSHENHDLADRCFLLINAIKTRIG